MDTTKQQDQKTKKTDNTNRLHFKSTSYLQLQNVFQQLDQQPTSPKDHITTTTIRHRKVDNGCEFYAATSHDQTTTKVHRKDNYNEARMGMTHRRVYRRARREKLWRTPHICTIIMDRNELGHALHTPSLPASHKAEYRRIHRKMTTTLYVNLIQRTVAGSNIRLWKRRPLQNTPRTCRGPNRKLHKPYSTRTSYHRDDDGQLRRRRCRFAGQIPKGHLMGGAPTTTSELLPFCYYIARIEELQQEERKDGEVVDGL